MSGNEAAIEVGVMRLPHAADLPLPAYQSALAAGLDLVAAVPLRRAGGHRAWRPRRDSDWPCDRVAAGQ